MSEAVKVANDVTIDLFVQHNLRGVEVIRVGRSSSNGRYRRVFTLNRAEAVELASKLLQVAGKMEFVP